MAPGKQPLEGVTNILHVRADNGTIRVYGIRLNGNTACLNGTLISQLIEILSFPLYK